MKRLKDYLSSNDRLSVIFVNHLIVRIDELTGSLIKTNNITTEERKQLKTSSTLLKKAIDSIVSRQNKSSRKTLMNEISRSGVWVDVHEAIKKYCEKKNSSIDAAYEENRDYYKLVELILNKNCRNCDKCGSECDFYHEFEEQHVPDFSGTIKLGNCKYSYSEE